MCVPRPPGRRVENGEAAKRSPAAEPGRRRQASESLYPAVLFFWPQCGPPFAERQLLRSASLVPGRHSGVLCGGVEFPS